MPLWITLRRYISRAAALLVILTVLGACGEEPNEERIDDLEADTEELEERLDRLEERMRAREQGGAS